MDRVQFDKITRYTLVMEQAKRMLAQRLITAQEYAKIDTIIAEKIGISSGSIYLENDLIISRFRGNM